MGVRSGVHVRSILYDFFFFLKDTPPPDFSPLPHPAPLPLCWVGSHRLYRTTAGPPAAFLIVFPLPPVKFANVSRAAGVFYPPCRIILARSIKAPPAPASSS